MAFIDNFFVINLLVKNKKNIRFVQQTIFGIVSLTLFVQANQHLALDGIAKSKPL